MPTLTLPALAPKLARALYSRSWLRILDLWACRQARRSLYPVSWTAAFLHEVVRVPVFLMALGSAVASSLCLWHGRFLDGVTLALWPSSASSPGSMAGSTNHPSSMEA